jgi:hypothetical protein
MMLIRKNICRGENEDNNKKGDNMKQLYKIYKITDQKNSKEYIGRTQQQLSVRLKMIKTKQEKANPELQQWLAENRNTLQINLIEETQDKQREAYWIKTRYEQGADVLNIMHHPVRHEIYKKNVGAVHKGKPESEETKKNIKLALARPEVKTKMNKAKSGANHPLYGKKGKDSPNYGSTRSEETKKRMSENIKLAMARPEIKEKQIKNIKLAMARPEVRKKRSISVKKGWITRRNNIKYKKLF